MKNYTILPEQLHKLKLINDICGVPALDQKFIGKFLLTLELIKRFTWRFNRGILTLFWRGLSS